MGMADEEIQDGEDIFYIPQKSYDKVKGKLDEGKDISKDDIDELTDPDKMADEDIMIPVDMRGVDSEFDDVEELVGKLGCKGTAKAFVDARKYFLDNKDGAEEDDRPQTMTVGDWKELMNDGVMLGEGEGEEEELIDDEEEDEDEEPAAKKAKTD